MVIKDGVTAIGNQEFKECRNIVEVTIPDSVVYIGKDVFDSTIGLPSHVTWKGTTYSSWDSFETAFRNQ